MKYQLIGKGKVEIPRGGCRAKVCGSGEDRLQCLSDEVRHKVRDHPCYSEEAHHYYARMHVAVAPACNIQCHYCNRKYDCANESRPGVVSEVVTPEQAVRKVLAVAAAIPQMTVVGIAGPGDALATPERTFTTFRALFKSMPDIKLCVSTNGLALPQHVEELSKCNVEHVTITINCLDPDVGTQIYPWIIWNKRRIKGKKGVEILLEQQQTGLQMAIERGMLVKVNSVMIPGINDEHLKEVSRFVRQTGAFLHNVLPLIAEPEHGTYYGLTGQRGPSREEFEALQDECGGDMQMMRHCRQCRADAVGLLGKDRGAEFTLDRIEQMEIDYEAVRERRAEVHAAIEEERAEKVCRKLRTNVVSLNSVSVGKKKNPRTYRPVRMAVATTGSGIVNQHFGHADEFLIYEVSTEGSRFIGHRRANRYCSGSGTCGDNHTALRYAVHQLKDCKAILCARIGFQPSQALEAAGIAPHDEHSMAAIDDALAAVYKEMLENGEVEELR